MNFRRPLQIVVQTQLVRGQLWVPDKPFANVVCGQNHQVSHTGGNNKILHESSAE